MTGNDFNFLPGPLVKLVLALAAFGLFVAASLLLAFIIWLAYRIIT